MKRLSIGYHAQLPLYSINIAGYPEDKAYGTMWRSFCAIQVIEAQKFYYNCDTNGGMSGSPAYVYFGQTGNRIIYGIHAYGVTPSASGWNRYYNSATRITQSVFDNLVSWKSQY